MFPAVCVSAGLQIILMKVKWNPTVLISDSSHDSVTVNACCLVLHNFILCYIHINSQQMRLGRGHIADKIYQSIPGSFIWYCKEENSFSNLITSMHCKKKKEREKSIPSRCVKGANSGRVRFKCWNTSKQKNIIFPTYCYFINHVTSSVIFPEQEI